MLVVLFLLSFLITVAIEKRLIPFLRQKATQPIYEDGPAWHISKNGTPTMGGIGFLIAITLSLLFFVAFSKENQTVKISVLISLLFAIANSVIGIVDDLTKIRKKENAGLSPKEKIVFQLIIAILFLMARRYFLGDYSILGFRFGEFDLGLFYYPLAIVIILGTVNCANLTDGIDGLASSEAITIGFAFLALSGIAQTDINVISASMVGGAVGFLLFNRHPAGIFMGDTGSLLLGALATSLAFSFENPTIILFLGGVYAIEGISVILQVVYYKLTKKRLFKMAPLHHHLEKCGLSENIICLIAVCSTVFLSILAALLFKL